MRRVISLILCMAMVGMLSGCSEKKDSPDSDPINASSSQEMQTAEKKNVQKKVYHILSGSSESSTTYKVLKELADRYQSEVNPDFEYETEIITNTNDLWKKLNMYITADDVPDIFSISNGLISEELIRRGELVNMTEELKKFGVYDSVNTAIKDFFKSEWLF